MPLSLPLLSPHLPQRLQTPCPRPLTLRRSLLLPPTWPTYIPGPPTCLSLHLPRHLILIRKQDTQSLSPLLLLFPLILSLPQLPIPFWEFHLRRMKALFIQS